MQYPPVKAAQLPGFDSKQAGEGAALIRWTNLRKPPARVGKCEFIQGATVAETAGLLADRLIAEKVI